MDEIEIIQIPCDDINEKQVRVIELLLELAKALNIEGESDKSETKEQEERAA